MISALLSGGVTLAAVIGVIGVTAGAVASFLRLKGDTREAIENSADKRVNEAREQVVQMATVSREWRENFEGLEKMRREEENSHSLEIKALRNRLDETRSELATALAATDLSGLEERMNTKFDTFLLVQEKQTEILTSLAHTVKELHAGIVQSNGKH